MIKSRKVALKLSKSFVRLRRFFLVLCSLLAAALLYYLLFDQTHLTVSRYSIESPKITNSFRLVLLSDLHNREFGERNSRLVEAIRAEKPDLIALAGDLNLNSDPDDRVVLELCEQLPAIAPTYYCIGNHEYDVLDHSTLAADVQSTGVIWLDDEAVSETIAGNELSIGGLTMTPVLSDSSAAFVEEYVQTDQFKLLLCHYPEYCLWGLQKEPIDLIVSGHAHGGQIRIPFVGGLYAPEQGYWPKLVDGVHQVENVTLAITRGLGNSNHLPRVNNPPEYVVIEIRPER